MGGGLDPGTVEADWLGAPMYFSGYPPEENRRFLEEAGLRVESGQPETILEDGRVSCLLDFEFAVLAPVELDASHLLGGIYAPRDEPDALPDPDGSGRSRLQTAVTRAVLPALRQPGTANRLLGYAVLRQLWSTNGWLARWDGREDFAAWPPYQALAALAAGTGGYLTPVLSLLP
jgi:scyllo-inosamine 4-kinase